MSPPLRGLILLLVPLVTIGQKPGVVLQINELAFSATDNAARISSVLNDLKQQSFNGWAPALIRFKHLMNESQRQRFRQHTGIVLQDYLGNQTYCALIPDNGAASLLADSSLFGIYPLDPMLRLSPVLQKRPFPEPIVQADGRLRITVIGFRSLPHNALREALHLLFPVVQAFSAHENIFEVAVHPDSLLLLASLPFVRYVSPGFAAGTYDNKEEVAINRAHYLNSGHLKAYDGSGVWIALNDDGAVSDHIDWQGRIDNAAIGTANEGDHGNHLAGTIGGAGNLNPRARGHAPAARIKTYFAYQNYQPQYGAWFDIPNTYWNPGVTLTNTAVSDLLCNEGYNALSQMLDQQALDYPLLTHVLSAGNAGQENCGPIASFYTITGGHKVAKNCITVGSVDDLDKLDEISSRGPAKDGRLKPEIVAGGVEVYSTYGINNYKTLSGTSMACAGVTGVLALLTQAYKEQNGGKLPPSALLKAAVLNTADDMGWAGPDWKHGYGRINALRAERLLAENRYMSGQIDHQETLTFPLTVPAGVRQLKVMLYWHDAPAALGAPKDLVNDLNFQLQQPNGNILNPWILDPTPVKDSLNKAARRGVDTLNNHEQITLNNPVASADYQLIIQGASVPMGPQQFYIVYDFYYDELTLTYPVGGESWTPNEKEIIRWDTYGQLKPLTLEISYDNGATWNVVAILDSFIRSYEFTVPPQTTGKSKVRISRSDVSSESDAFSIFPAPVNLKWQQICPLSAQLTWNAVSGATHYEVFLLGSEQMQPVGTTTKNFFSFTGLNTNLTHWVAVRAWAADSVVSRRSQAIMKPAGLLNCTLNSNVAVTEILPAPYVYTTCMGMEQTTVGLSIKNTASSSLSGFYLSYQVNGGTPVTEWYGGTVNAGEQITHLFSTAADLSAAGKHELRCWVTVAGDENPWDDTLQQFITVTESLPLPLPIHQTFDSFTKCETTNSCTQGVCPLADGWLNLTNLVYDSIDWRVHSGSTPGEFTGPGTDFNSPDGKGNYIYLEAGTCKNKEAHLLLPCVDLTATKMPRLAFARHQYGQAMGSLSVDIFAQGSWHLNWFFASGNQGDVWLTDTLDLSTFSGSTITVRFRGLTGNASTSDLALDAISLYDLAAVFPEIAYYGNACTDNVLLFTNVSNSQATWQEWSFGPDALPQMAWDQDTVAVTFLSAGFKTITLTAGNSYDTATVTKNLLVSKAPDAQFTILPSQTGSFEFISTSADADTCQWYFGDGSTATGCHVLHDYSESGVFTVLLIAGNGCGSDTAFADVVITPVPSNTLQSLRAAPNPFTSRLTVAIPADAQVPALLRIYRPTGQFLYQREVQPASNILLPADTWPSGLYILELADPLRVERLKLIRR